MTESDRIAAVEAELERMRTNEQRLMGPPQPPIMSGLGKELQARQDAARRARQDAVDAQDQAYQAQLAENAPQREQLRARLRDIDSQLAAEQARHDAAEAKIATDRQAISGKLAKLEAVPPMPAVAVPPPGETGWDGRSWYGEVESSRARGRETAARR